VITAKCRELRQAVSPSTQVCPLSGATGAGVPEVVAAVLATVSAARMDQHEAEAEASSFVHPL